MKKLLALILVLACTLALASCLGGTEGNNPEAEDNSGSFAYTLLDDGSYSVTGLTEEGKLEKTLTIPATYEGKNVTVVAKGAFDGAAVETVIIPEDTNLRVLSNGAFSGAASLSKVYIYFANADQITPPTDFADASKDLTVYVPEGSSYDVAYSWEPVANISGRIQYIGE